MTNRQELWAGSITVFLILSFATPYAFAADAWCDLPTCDTNWSFRKKITIDNTKVSGTSHTDFAVLISLTDDTDLKSPDVKNAGEDIRFTNEDGSAVLSYEIESFSNDATDGTLVAWVKIPTLSATADTVLYMYNGNSGASSTANAANVWDSNYKGVWHFSEDPSGSAPQMLDSTSNDNDGTSVGSMTTSDQVAGQIDGSLDLEGTDDHVDAGTSSTLNLVDKFTLEAWINSDNAAGGDSIMTKRSTITDFPFAFIADGGQLKLFARGAGDAVSATSTDPITANQFVHVVVTRAANDDINFYIDGVADSGGTQTLAQGSSNPNVDFFIGAQNLAGTLASFFDGLIDEVRVSSTVRSADFITTEYNNQNIPGTFYSVSTRDQLVSSDAATVMATGSGSVTITLLNSNPEALAPSGRIVGSFFDISSSGSLSDRIVTLSYTDAEIVGINESSLVINRFSGGVWTELTTTVDTGANTATAPTPDFSSFVLGGSSLSGGGDVKPSYSVNFAENEYPISIGNTKFTFEELGFNNPTTIIETGKSIPVNLLIYDNEGPSYIQQVELYTNLNGIFRDVSDSDTYIIYKKGNPIIVWDPNGFFSEVIFSSSEVNKKLQLTYEITFAKEMEKSDIIVQARDKGNNVGVLTVSNAWQVIPDPTIIETTETPVIESTDVSVPVEIKVKSLNTDKTSYFKEQEITFSGTVDEYDFGKIVTIIIRSPSSNFVTLISTFPDRNSYFETTIELNKKFKTDGTYTATAFTDDINKGIIVPFDFSFGAPPVITSPAQSAQDETTTTAESTITFEPTTTTESTTTAESTTTSESTTPKPMPSFVDPEKDPQSYVARYNNEESYKEWFDENYSDYTIYEAVDLPNPKAPQWVKNNAKWWSEEKIDNETFVSGIQFLMTEKIIDIPDLPEQASEKPMPSFVDPEKDPQSYVDRYNNEESYKEWFDENYSDYTIEAAVGIPESIPEWIKNNAKWWADDLLSEEEFLNGIKYLVEQGIIKTD